MFPGIFGMGGGAGAAALVPDAMGMAKVIDALASFQKTVSETNVSDMQLVRQDLSATLAVNAPVDTPVRNRLNRATGNGAAHSWYKANANAYGADGSLFLGTTPDNAVFAAGGLPSFSNEAYSLVSAPYRAIGDIAQVTIHDQAFGRSYKDLMELRTRIKMINTALIEEWMIVNGDSATNSLMFDGMIKLFDQNNEDRGGAQLSLGPVSTVHRRVNERGGNTRFNVMSPRLKQKFNDLILTSYFGIRLGESTLQPNAQQIGAAVAGMNITKWDFGQGPTDLVSSRMMRPSGGSAAGVERWLCVDHLSMNEEGNTCEMVDCLPMSSFDLARVASTWGRKLLMELTVLKVAIPHFQGQVTNIGAPTFAS